MMFMSGSHLARQSNFATSSRIRTFPGSDALLDRQYGARGLGSSRQSDSSVGDRHGTSRNGFTRNDRTDLAPTLSDSATLACSHHGWLARDLGSVAGPRRQRALICTDAVLLVELPGVRIGRHHCFALLALGDGRFSEGLATEGKARETGRTRPCSQGPRSSKRRGTTQSR